MKKILVPVDFSAQSVAAVDAAIVIAKKANSEIFLLHVIEQPQSGSFNVEGEVLHDSSGEDQLFTLMLIKKSRKELAKFVETIQAAGIVAHEALRLGNPYHGINTIITEQQIDLVVMGTVGHPKWERLLDGSTTDKVVRHAMCPVLTVHQKFDDSSFKNIVYATSLIGEEDVFSALATKLQTLFGSMIHVVWINTPELFEPEGVAMKALKNFADRLWLKNYTLNVFSDYSEEEGILNFANSINANLIMLPTHGRKGLNRILSGSVAEEISQKATLPVLTATLQEQP